MKARSMHARNKQIASAIGIQLPIRLGRLNSLSPTPARLTRGHLTPDAALGLFWLVLPVLPGFEPLNQKNCSAPKKLFSSPRLLCNLIPRQSKLSSPSRVEYLAYSSVWNACTRKDFSGPKKLFSPPASFATSYHAKINFQALAWWNIWPVSVFGMPAPENTFRDLKSFLLPPASFASYSTPKWIGKTLTIWTP